MKRKVLFGCTLANPLRPVISVILAAVLAILCLAGFPHRCTGANEPRVGPMPSENYMPDPLAREQWRHAQVGSEPQAGGRQELNDTGKIVFSWEQLIASYPEPARTLDNYVEQRRIGMVAALTKLHTPYRIDWQFTTPRTPSRLKDWVRDITGSSPVPRKELRHSYLEIS